MIREGINQLHLICGQNKSPPQNTGLQISQKQETKIEIQLMTRILLKIKNKKQEIKYNL